MLTAIESLCVPKNLNPCVVLMKSGEYRNKRGRDDEVRRGSVVNRSFWSAHDRSSKGWSGAGLRQGLRGTRPTLYVPY